MPTTDYVMNERTILQAALEATYGDDSGLTLEDLPIYDLFTPMQHRQEFSRLNRASDSRAQDGGTSKEPYTAIAFKTFAYGSGSATAPPWARILVPGAGFMRAVPTGSAPTIATETHAGTGTLPAVATGYRYKFATYTIATGVETVATAATTTTGPLLVNKKVTLTVGSAIASGTVLRVYRTKDGGSTYYLNSEQVYGTTTWDDEKWDYELDQTRQPVAAASESNIWTPRNKDYDSLSFKGYMDAFSRMGKGGRGSFRSSWKAGDHWEFNWDYLGLYAAAVAAANPTGTSCAGPGMPPRVDNVALSIIPRDTLTTWQDDLGNGAGDATPAGTAITPLIVQGMDWTPGTITGPRKDANYNGVVREIAIIRKQEARIKVMLEVDKDFQWDPVEDYNRGARFGFIQTVHPLASITQTHRRMELSAPNCQIVEAPVLSDGDGYKIWEVTFEPQNLLSCTDSQQFRIY